MWSLQERILKTLQDAYKNNAFHAAFALHYIYRKKPWECKAVMVDPIKPLKIQILGVFLRGVSWYHEISVGGTRASHSSSQSIHAGSSGAELTLKKPLHLQLEHATMLSFPEIQEPQHQDQEVPGAPRGARTHLCPWTSYNGQATAVLCCMEPQLGLYTDTCGHTGT